MSNHIPMFRFPDDINLKSVTEDAVGLGIMSRPVYTGVMVKFPGKDRFLHCTYHWDPKNGPQFPDKICTVSNTCDVKLLASYKDDDIAGFKVAIRYGLGKDAEWIYSQHNSDIPLHITTHVNNGTKAVELGRRMSTSNTEPCHHWTVLEVFPGIDIIEGKWAMYF